MRTTLAFAGLLLWRCLRNRALLKISVKNMPYFIGLGMFGIGSAQFFYLLAISKINVGTAILLHYTGPVFVALYVVVVRRQKLGFNFMLAIVGTLIGCFLVVGAYDLQLLAFSWGGIAAGLAAAVAFAVYSVSRNGIGLPVRYARAWQVAMRQSFWSVTFTSYTAVFLVWLTRLASAFKITPGRGLAT